MRLFRADNILTGFPARYPQVTAFSIYGLIAAVYAVLTDGVTRDDAYIFFTYARNLVDTGVLAFNRGEPSFGITSIGWTGLLAAGTVIYRNPIVVAKVLGVLLGAGGTVLWVRWLCRGFQVPFAVTAVALAAILPNIGADRMVTGMETGLLCFLSGLLLVVLASERMGRHWYGGAIVGLLILARPEAALALVATVIFLAIREGALATVKTVAGAALVSAWWPAWLYSRTGSILPPTRAGKLSVFLPEHLGVRIGQFEAGTVTDHLNWGVIALRQFAFSGISELSFFLLLVATTGSVAWAATKTSRGRWSLSALPPTAAWILVGLYCLAFPLLQLRYFVWLTAPLVISLYFSMSIIAPPRVFRLLVAGLFVGCLATQPVALARRIQSTNVQQVRRSVAEKIRELTPFTARIALEPIGEIGFFADRYIIDMGGITDTRIQAYVRNGYADLPAIWRCLDDFHADYLVTYDDDGFLGRLPRDYPDRFELVAYIPDQPVRGIRYRLLRILPH